MAALTTISPASIQQIIRTASFFFEFIRFIPFAYALSMVICCLRMSFSASN